MNLFCEILGIVISLPAIVLTAIWFVKFPKKVRRLSHNISEDGAKSVESIELHRSKQFFKLIVKLLLINLPAFIISISVFILYIILNGGVQFYPAPLIVALCGGTLSFLILDIYIKNVGKKNNIKVLNRFDKNLYPIGFASVAITSFCIVLGFIFADVIACAIYMLLLII